MENAELATLLSSLLDIKLDPIHSKLDEHAKILDDHSKRLYGIDEHVERSDNPGTKMKAKFSPSSGEEVSLDERVSQLSRRLDFQRNKIARIDETLELMQLQRASSSKPFSY